MTVQTMPVPELETTSKRTVLICSVYKIVTQKETKIRTPISICKALKAFKEKRLKQLICSKIKKMEVAEEA